MTELSHVMLHLQRREGRARAGALLKVICMTERRVVPDRAGQARRTGALLLISLATMLLVSACADRSYAPLLTSGVETWRFWLGIACGLLVLVWIALLGAIGVGPGPTSTAALGNLVSGIIFAIISCLMP